MESLPLPERITAIGWLHWLDAFVVGTSVLVELSHPVHNALN